MKKHFRNWQPRFYIQDGIYFVTFYIKNRYPFFKELLFCDLFLENLKLCKKIKQFKLYGWVICYDHIHLLLEPSDEWNISNIMHFLKRNFSRNINIVMGYSEFSKIGESADNYPHFRVRKQFFQKYPKTPFPTFQWQKSYYDHIIRDESDFDNHIQYIQHNPIKHNLSDNWRYVFTNPEYMDLIDCLE